MAVQNKSNVPIGTVLEGKFRVTREIGRGGMAAVYEAENIDIGKRVAVKVLAAELITSRVVRERFIREARAASAVRSPHICDVYDSGMFEERPFLVMELLEGESLYDMLTRLRRLDIPTVLAVATQTSRGLGKAHEANIVHRDLKPENIFVSRDEDGGLIVKLLDFGLAKFYEPTNDGDPKTVRLTREGALFGTPAYMSPEQAKGQGEVDHRSDLWALGCIIYECLTGQTVWSVEQGVAMILAQVASAPLPRPTRIRPDLPPTFDGWFQKALDRETDRRFQTARELSDALELALVPPEDDVVEIGGAGRQPSVHTETEAGHLDELMASSAQARAPESVRPPFDPFSPDSADGVTPGPVVASESRSSGLPALFIAAALVLGGYALWLTVLHPPGELDRSPQVRASRPTPSASGALRSESKARVQRDPDTEPFAELMREGQAMFAKDPAQALEKMKAAMALGSASPARSLLSHASVAVEEATKGGCKVEAIARPRPYTIEQQASAPALLGTSEGVLLAWVDTHADAKRRQAHVVLLDAALRRDGDPIAITPEASNVQGLELYPAGDKVLLLFYDDGGKQPGLYSRQLSLDGRITSPATRISRVRPLDHRVVLASAGDGARYAVWIEQLDAGVTDIMAAKLSSGFDALEEPRRLTHFPAIKGLAERSQGLSATIVRGELQSVFAVAMPGLRSEVFLLTTPLAALAGPKPPDPPKGKKPATPFVGTIRSVAKVVGRVPEPRVGCENDGCLVTWDEEKGGAFIAFLEHGRAQPLWHRQFAEKGARPVLGGDASGLALSWYEESRLKLAPAGRDGVAKPSLVNRVNGIQPHAEVARGAKPGEWLVAWRDYEAGHLELFALRAECP